MKFITKYQAVDGTEFFSEQTCVEWEQWCDDLAAANALYDDEPIHRLVEADGGRLLKRVGDSYAV